MGEKLSPLASSKQIEIEVEYVTLPEGENNERIERLTRKILRILENSGKRSRRNPGSNTHGKKVAEIFESDFEGTLGI